MWDLDAYRFLDGPAPDTANPSLWRQGQLLHQGRAVRGRARHLPAAGLRPVGDERDRGRHRRDRDRSADREETAAAAFALYTSTAATRPVKAMIYTHSHVDHFGGVKGIITQEQVDSGRGHGHRARALHPSRGGGERVRRAPRWPAAPATCTAPRSTRGPPARSAPASARPCRPATSTLIPPTMDITHTGEELTIDGVRIVFQMTPGTEAPAEMNFYFPDFRALVRRREHVAHVAQRADDPRRGGARHARVGALPHRDDRPVGRRPRRGVRVAPLADVGTRRVRSSSCRCSATCTSTSTIRRCGS